MRGWESWENEGGGGGKVGCSGWVVGCRRGKDEDRNFNRVVFTLKLRAGGGCGGGFLCVCVVGSEGC